MATTPYTNRPRITAPIGPQQTGSPPAPAGTDLGLLPMPAETPAEYLARLKALHTRVGGLIDAIESRRPVLAPVPAHPPRAASDRREMLQERRTATGDRRTGMPDERKVPIDRRYGKRDRRAIVVERREEHIERRRDPNPIPWTGQLGFNRTTLIWTLQVLVWVGVAAFVLIYGLG